MAMPCILIVIGCQEVKDGRAEPERDYAALCDEFAAHPQDPNRWSKDGVEDGAIAVGPAMSYCGKAIESEPTQPRFYFQYGRALQGSGKDEEAKAAFLKAYEFKYAPAFKCLADYFWDAKEVDPRTLYQYAFENGFAPAKDALVEYENYVRTHVYEKGIYDVTMDRLYERDFQGLRSDPSVTFLYMDGIYKKIEDPNYMFIDGTCPAILSSMAVNWGVPLGNFARLALSMMEDVSQDENCKEHPLVCLLVEGGGYLWKESYVADQASKDLIGLVNRYGCDNAITKTIFQNGLDYLAYEESGKKIANTDPEERLEHQPEPAN